MLICFEGVDASGKSTLSVDFLQWINTHFRDATGTLKADPHLGDFVWTKEPIFTSEEADRLNTPGYTDEYKRERIFFESRIRHQNVLTGVNCVCDRYIWSGLAYSYIFSPHCFEFARELYLSENLFIAPDLYVFVDTPPEVCFDRDPSLDLEKLKTIRNAYIRTRDYITQPVITMQALGGEARALDEFVKLFEEHMLKIEQEKQKNW